MMALSWLLWKYMATKSSISPKEADTPEMLMRTKSKKHRTSVNRTQIHGRLLEALKEIQPALTFQSRLLPLSSNWATSPWAAPVLGCCTKKIQNRFFSQKTSASFIITCRKASIWGISHQEIFCHFTFTFCHFYFLLHFSIQLLVSSDIWHKGHSNCQATSFLECTQQKATPLNYLHCFSLRNLMHTSQKTCYKQEWNTHSLPTERDKSLPSTYRNFMKN